MCPLMAHQGRMAHGCQSKLLKSSLLAPELAGVTTTLGLFPDFLFKESFSNMCNS